MRLAIRLAPFAAAVVILALVVSEPGTREFVLINAALQLALFGAIACLPAWRTGRMSYVDIAWPTGLVALGALTGALSGRSTFALATAAIYSVMGLRMAIGAITLWRQGDLDHELPRYRFQRLRWEKATLGSERLDLQAEILVQAASNIGPMAVPGVLAVATSGTELGPLGWLGLLIWAASWAMESVADAQKMRFVGGLSGASTNTCCDVGLWNYSRHPNYFFQWMQWNAIIVVSLPALQDAATQFGPAAFAGTGAGLFALSATMYWVLVYYTGAVPAEYYSVQKRPAYTDYQARTNRFFPGRPRKS